MYPGSIIKAPAKYDVYCDISYAIMHLVDVKPQIGPYGRTVVGICNSFPTLAIFLTIWHVANAPTLGMSSSDKSLSAVRPGVGHNIVWRRPPLRIESKGLVKYRYQIVSSAEIPH